MSEEELKNEVNEGQLTIIDPDGKETLCQILFTMESKEFGHSYVVFYPIDSYDKTPEDGELEIMGARYVVNEDGTGELSDLETEEEFAMLDKAVKDFQEQEYDEEDEEDEDETLEECSCECDKDDCDCEEDSCCCEEKGNGKKGCCHKK